MKYQFERNKLYAYLGDDLVGMLKQHKCFVAGGTITSLFCNRDINDIDIYFRDEQSLVNFLYEIWDDKLYIVAHTKKATLIKFGKIDIQLVHFDYFGSAEAIFDTFDYTVCMGAFDFATEEFTLHDDFLQHNSQRILKFNKDTAFPIVSLLRVQKYRDKGYTISKPEFIRIALSCMNLNITSYAQLKEQMGGMYGVNYDKLFEFSDDEPFNLDTVIDKIADLNLDEDYFKMPVPVKFDDVEDIIDNITDKKPRYFQLNNHWYKVNLAGVIMDRRQTVDDAEIIDGAEYINGLKFYKFVMKKDGRYLSFYDNDFEYIVSEVAEARWKQEKWAVHHSGDPVLYFTQLEEIKQSGYYNHRDNALIEVSVDAADWVKKEGHQVTAKRCTVLREVPQEEYTR